MNPREPHADARIPLVFGVTGHRDLRDEDRPALENAVRAIFTEFKSRYPSTPQVLLSPLAEGADRLVAAVALEPDISARLAVPLPMSRALYETDFETTDSLRGFEKLLAGAHCVFELPHLAPVDQISAPGDARNAQYAALGEFIVRHCQILIALWDGAGAQGEGGTAEIVNLQTQGAPAHDRRVLEPPEGFPVRWIVTPRLSNPTPARTPFAAVPLYPGAFAGDDKKAAKYYARIFGRIDQFNRRIAHPDSAFARDVEKSESWVASGISDDELSARDRAALERYGMADALAIRCQNKVRRMQYALHWAVFLGFAFFVFYAHAPAHDWQWLAGSGAALFVAIVLLLANRRYRLDTNHQDFRAVAEGLRVAFFWRLTGISDSVADHYLGKQRSELDWIRSGLRGWQIPSPAAAAAQRTPERELQIALRNWVVDQRDYFKRSAKREEGRAVVAHLAVRTLMFAAVFAGVVLFALALRGVSPEILFPLVIVVDLLLAAAALWHNCAQYMAYEQHAKQYSRMHAVFANAATIIGNAADSRDACEWLHELGKQALAENGDWVLLHRERPLELPHP